MQRADEGVAHEAGCDRRCWRPLAGPGPAVGGWEAGDDGRPVHVVVAGHGRLSEAGLQPGPPAQVPALRLRRQVLLSTLIYTYDLYTHIDFN